MTDLPNLDGFRDRIADMDEACTALRDDMRRVMNAERGSDQDIALETAVENLRLAECYTDRAFSTIRNAALMARLAGAA